jgi:hypothetical protein
MSDETRDLDDEIVDDFEYEPTPYEVIRALNWSSLKHMAVSPRLYRHRLANPEGRKRSFVLGGAGHCEVLEPELFDARYAEWTGKQRRGKAWEAWREENPGKISLSPGELRRVRAVGAAVREDGLARELLRGGRREEIVTWEFTVGGVVVPCKGRMDYLRPDFLIDLKLTRDPVPSRFERDAYNYGYLAQAAWYHDGAVAARLIDGRERPFIIAAKNCDDFDVVSYQLTEEALSVGRSIYQRLLRRLVECEAADFWPGCAPGLQPLRAPEWAVAQTMALEHEEEVF